MKRLIAVILCMSTVLFSVAFCVEHKKSSDYEFYRLNQIERTTYLDKYLSKITSAVDFSEEAGKYGKFLFPEGVVRPSPTTSVVISIGKDPNNNLKDAVLIWDFDNEILTVGKITTSRNYLISEAERLLYPTDDFLGVLLVIGIGFAIGIWLKNSHKPKGAIQTMVENSEMMVKTDDGREMSWNDFQKEKNKIHTAHENNLRKKNHEIYSLMISELEHSDFYKADYWPEVLARINKSYQFGAFTSCPIRDRDVFPANAVLSPEEKRRLGLNPRMKIPREMADSMTPYGLQQDNLKTIISDMALKYARIIENQETLAEYKKAGVKYVEIKCINDTRTCEACRQKSGKVYLIDEAPIGHCENKYCRCLYVRA